MYPQPRALAHNTTLAHEWATWSRTHILTDGYLTDDLAEDIRLAELRYWARLLHIPLPEAISHIENEPQILVTRDYCTTVGRDENLTRSLEEIDPFIVELLPLIDAIRLLAFYGHRLSDAVAYWIESGQMPSFDPDETISPSGALLAAFEQRLDPQGREIRPQPHAQPAHNTRPDAR